MRSLANTVDKMRETLMNCVVAGEPFCIKKKNDEIVVTFVRGFADPDRNIILISEKSHSIGMNFIEIKHIQEVQPWIQSAA
jgi:hypothetical protein